MEIKLIIDAPELSEAINNLAKALTGTQCICKQHGENNTQIDNAGTVNMEFSAPAEEPQPEPIVPTAPTVPVAPQPEPQPEPTPVVPTAPTVPVAQPQPAEPQYTMDMIARAGTALVDAGKMNEVIALLGKYGVSVLTDLDPSKYSDMANDLRQLGASI